MSAVLTNILRGVNVFVLAMLLFPVIVVVGISFSSASFLRFPPPGLSLQWYEKILTDPSWVNALVLTVQVGVISVVVAVVVSVPMAIALVRYVRRGRGFLSGLLLSTFMTPTIIQAISIYQFYVPLGLLDTVYGLAFAHAVSGIPFVVINVVASLGQIDENIERAAVAHGARPARAFVNVTLPIIAPSVMVGAIFAFMHSAHELLIATFVLGTIRKPISVKLWEGVKVTVDPTIAAATTSVIALGVLLLIMIALIRRTDVRRRAA
ncbi:ABC transporter permease [Acuticoccus mangrovi]|uniref:ABC transporter permease n=1 Tax=Acuticoccus mangrovi TaxID=2796142 RepID=A0A934IUB3_9HYPH|nr:ABC transporter permease [Acuticoccus mangrovi]MBJ3777864.1 ABC transporter permease [Acuticoccus mangrovi]